MVRPFPRLVVSEAPVQLLDREIAFDGFFRVDRYRLRHRRHAGGWSEEMTREVLDRGNAVGLLLYDPERDAVVLIEQFRLAAHLAGFAPFQLEIIAGIADRDGEAEVALARREAQEEAGLVLSGELLPVHRFMSSPGGTTETVSIFCARVDCRRAAGIHGLAEEHEDIKVVVKPYDEVRRLLRAGRIENAFTTIALYWLAANRARLRRRWEVGSSGGHEETSSS